MIRSRIGILSLAPLFLVLPGTRFTEDDEATRRAPGPQATDEDDLAEPTVRLLRGANDPSFGIGACRSDIVLELWPPNHKVVDIDLAQVLGSQTVGIVITSITQDEPVDDRGDGHTVCDGDGIGTSVAHIRAERSGRLDGRVYEIDYTAFGGACSGFVTVTVPHDQSGVEAVDSGQLHDSTEGCH